jgi:predicted transcriptional regulator
MAVNTKRAAIEMIERLRDDVSLEEIIYELYFRERVDRGIRELDEGKTVSHEEVERSLATWLQSAGR